MKKLKLSDFEASPRPSTTKNEFDEKPKEKRWAFLEGKISNAFGIHHEKITINCVFDKNILFTVDGIQYSIDWYLLDN